MRKTSADKRRHSHLSHSRSSHLSHGRSRYRSPQVRQLTCIKNSTKQVLGLVHRRPQLSPGFGRGFCWGHWLNFAMQSMQAERNEISGACP